MNRVVHFEILSDNPEQSQRFYENVFGWRFDKWQGPFDYWLVMTGDEKERGIDGGLKRPEGAGSQRTVNTIGVKSLDQTLREIQKHGGKILQGKMPIPGVGYLAYCQDPGGIVFGILEVDMSAQG
jgi:predicted enzyme related to lactoylglutathione lyase